MTTATVTARTGQTLKRPSIFATRSLRQQSKKLQDELFELRQRYGGLVGDILDHGIDYAEVLEIRTAFYGRIHRASLKKYADPVAKLELYKRLTKQYHGRFIARRIVFAGHEDIGKLHELDTTIARITYRIIDLSNSDKNDFVRTMKQVREIHQALQR